MKTLSAVRTFLKRSRRPASIPGAIDFGPDILARHIISPIAPKDFMAFEKDFSRLIENRDLIYSRIPGGDTWPDFEPPREKILEYYLSMEPLGLGSGSTYLDIASCLSLFPNYVVEKVGATVYRQDLFYPEGMRPVEFPRLLTGKQGIQPVQIFCLGSHACSLPLGDSSADAISLHCSFEHFEGDADGRFVKEGLRVLRPGGRLLIIPFYCGAQYQEIFKEDYATGCQFQRYYDPPQFLKRVLSGVRVPFAMEIRYYINARMLDKTFYCDYSLTFVKGRK